MYLLVMGKKQSADWSKPYPEYARFKTSSKQMGSYFPPLWYFYLIGMKKDKGSRKPSVTRVGKWNTEVLDVRFQWDIFEWLQKS